MRFDFAGSTACAPSGKEVLLQARSFGILKIVRTGHGLVQFRTLIDNEAHFAVARRMRRAGG
jgi:hypothetical protein